MKEVITSCTQDCPDTCSIIAEVKGDQVVRIGGNPRFRITRGFLCRKSRNFLPRIRSHQRILSPLLRNSGSWRQITWEKAIDVIATKLEESLRTYGPLSIFYFRDAGSIAALKIVNERFFNLLGGVTFASGSLCGGAGIAGQTLDFGLRTSHDPFDILNSKVILIWGRNPAWTNVHLVPILLEARRAGSFLILIDPLPTATSKLVDWHIAPVPGSDCYLALGLIKIILDEGMEDKDFIMNHIANFESFEEATKDYDFEVISEMTGVTLSEIKRLARMYARAKPAAIIGGWGLQRRRNGAQVYRLLDALGAVSGNIGIPGGGVSHGMDENRWFSDDVTLRREAAFRREIPKPQTWRGILSCENPPIKVAFITAANPVNQCPGLSLAKKAMGSIDFIVVNEMFMTDTARMADLVLPTTHFLQETDLVGSYWHNYVMPVNVAQGRLGLEKSDLEIFALLAKKMGLERDFPDDPIFFLSLLVKPLEEKGLKLRELMHEPVRVPSCDVPFSDRKFPTSSGKMELLEEIKISSTRLSDDYPYHLVSPHPHTQTHSQAPSIPPMSYPEAWISEQTARKLDVDRGGLLRVRTSQGELICRAGIMPGLRDDVVVVMEGTWETKGGSVNRLTPDDLTDEGLSATYNDIACNLSRIEPTTLATA